MVTHKKVNNDKDDGDDEDDNAKFNENDLPLSNDRAMNYRIKSLE